MKHNDNMWSMYEKRHQRRVEGYVPKKVGEQTTETIDAICRVSDGLRDLLLIKNRRYGDSALKPLGIFTAHSHGASEGLYARLDDKLGRISNASEIRKNDVADLMGYLVLLCVQRGWVDFGDLVD